jgi:Prenyltransferase and squalene oxidase repeat
MRVLLLLAASCVPLSARAQTAAIERAIDLKLEAQARDDTLKYIASLYDTASGAYKVDAAAKPTVRASNGASKAIKYLGGKVRPDREKTAAFILSTYDPATGAFAEIPGKPDVASTAVGVITAAEFGIPHEKIAKSLDYLKANAKSFDDVRLAAAAVEAWGVKDCPFKVDEWLDLAKTHIKEIKSDAANGGAREMGSAAALVLRLNAPVGKQESDVLINQLKLGQRDDGGWGKKDATASDAESNYRVMRALWLLKTKPANANGLRSFIARCRNTDGGYGVEPGKPSNMSGTYYAMTILHWLEELEK